MEISVRELFGRWDTSGEKPASRHTLENWVHGQAGVIEPAYNAEGIPLVGRVISGSSDGASYAGVAEAEAWFCFPIPTVVKKDDVQVRLNRLYILFRSESGVEITTIHVWDGPRRIDAFEPSPGISGMHDGSRGPADLVPNVTSWTLGHKPEISWGLCISVYVRFKEAGGITFVGVGVALEY
jgi:hypothetical protein